ncbi:hypothetical protein [Neisseria montereyensis]|uniref:Uncharacterized protein n=1 Tax=Neisseria montereyensis TaxID=2973938 RepID=A0ABT2FDF3_9NEIS|nr:hypothetical protein [Neisseria montereyensis]MCS4534237.1 hypothetical protein [Neisseria montereyensis]
MTKTTRLTQQDLQIYPSQRLTDTPDGGGLMVGKPLTGEDNEIFPPISDVDRTMGSFDARLLYPGVLRPDAEPLYGSHFIISEPPKADNVSFLAFKARNYGESRAEIMPRIEAYSVPTVESRMTLLGRHMAGIRMIQAYQRVEAPLPTVGERYCLEMRETSGSKNIIRYQYFRISDLEHEIRTFEIPLPGGGIKEIQRRVLKMEIYNPLSDDYNGTAYPVEGYAGNGVAILETQVADSATYYGVRPLAQALNKGALELRVDTIYEKLVPTSTVETPYVDQYPVSAEAWVPAGSERVIFKSEGSVSGNIWLEHPVIPGTVKIQGWEDDAQGRLIKDGAIVNIDYKRGLIVDMPPSYALTVTAVPGAAQKAIRNTTYIEIKDTNQGTQWAPLLQPAPLRGSLVVSFMSLGVWYTLRDMGDGILRDNENNPCGTVEPTGSAVVSLPSLPDVGTNLVFAWSPVSDYTTFQADKAGTDSVAQSVSGWATYPRQQAGRIKPGTLTMNWNDGEAKTATDNGTGKLTGHAEGDVLYDAGRVKVSSGINASTVRINWQEYTDSPVTTALESSTQGTLRLSAGKTAPGSLNMKTVVRVSVSGVRRTRIKIGAGPVFGGYEYEDTTRQSDSQSFVAEIGDNGQGGLVMGGKVLDGASINYADGAIVLPASAFKIAAYGYQDALAEIGAGAKKINIRGQEYELDDFTATFVSATATVIPSETVRAVEKTETVPTMSFNVLRGGYAGSRVVPDTWAFSAGDTKIIERGGQLYKNWDYQTGTGDLIGNLNTATGEIVMSDISINLVTVKIIAGIIGQPETKIGNFVGRTPAAPIKPESFTVYATETGSDGQVRTLTGRSNALGEIDGELKGKIHYETGFFSVEGGELFYPDTLRFNCVSQDNIPLDSSIIGIDSVRLPSDGRVPVYRKGDMIVIGNRIKQDLGSVFTGGQTVQLDRQNSDRIGLVDAKGKHVLADKYSYDLTAGTITFADPLDLSDYTYPLTAVQAWEEENRVMGVDISGTLKLQFPVGRDYPKESTYISSALIGGDLLVRATEPFSQQTWDNVWADDIRGNPILSRLDVKNYPIKLTSNGAITERWLLRFIGTDQYELYGERLGLIAKGDTLGDLAPTNPATGKPYFTINHLSFGGGWASGNCVRFNTYGTPTPVWILRAVQPTTVKQTERDGFSACLRGNTVIDEQP